MKSAKDLDNINRLSPLIDKLALKIQNGGERYLQVQFKLTQAEKLQLKQLGFNVGYIFTYDAFSMPDEKLSNTPWSCSSLY